MQPKGPLQAKVLVIGEAPGESEIREGVPFVGQSGRELDKMLFEAGFHPGEIRFTNTINIRPPNNDIEVFFPSSKKAAEALPGSQWLKGCWVTKEVPLELQRLELEISQMPDLELIIPTGNTPLWALTGNDGITKWRGSQLKVNGKAVVPILHPASVLRQWENRWITVLDLKRAKRWMGESYAEPRFDFLVAPSFNDASDYLSSLLSELESSTVEFSCDIETRFRHIACVGFGRSTLNAACIPFLAGDGSYWPLKEEQVLWEKICRILLHPNARVIGQNFLYDRQYFAKHLGIRSRLDFDTMMMQHVCFPGVPKGLDFISSQYNHFHSYWKDESKEWDPKVGEKQLWTYNCKDAVVTWEAKQHLEKVVKAFNHSDRLAFQMQVGELAFDMMLRGIAVDLEGRDQLEKDLSKALDETLEFLHLVLGSWFEPTSPKKVMHLCYDILQLKKIFVEAKGKARRPTANAAALEEHLESCEPIYRPVLQAILDYRSLSVYRNTFVRAPLDPDHRFRCSINVAGPVTYRWSSSSDAFGYGTNMQNIPRGEDD